MRAYSRHRSAPAAGRRPSTGAAALGLAIATFLAAPSARAEPANRIIARVNDSIATLYDYEIRFEDALRRVGDVPEDPTDREQYLDQVARDVMQNLFEELLILSRADQLAIQVTAAEVTESINRMREGNGLEDEEQFRAALAQSGMTPEVLRSQFEQQMRSQRVVGREVYSELKLGEEDLRRHYRDHLEEFRKPAEVKLREVVVLDDSGTSPAAAATAATLVAELRAGKPLEEAVAALAADAVSGVIELGWVVAEDLDPALKDAAWDLPAGGWSEPTRGRGGVHVAQVLERRESTIPSFKDVEAEIRAREERARLDVKMKDYLDDLEKKAYLYLDPPPQAAGFRKSSGVTSGANKFPFVVAGAAETGKDAAAATAVGKDTAADAADDDEAATDEANEKDAEDLGEDSSP